MNTLWLTLLLVFTILIVIVAGLTFADSMSFITGTDWKRVDTNTCEKEMVFRGVTSCDITINRYVDSLNGTEKIILSPSTVPDCYEKRCK